MNLRILSVLTSATLFACNGQTPTFNWSPELWATDSRSQIIKRKDVEIPTNDPRFDGMICMKIEEVGKAQQACHEVMLQCEKWK